MYWDEMVGSKRQDFVIDNQLAQSSGKSKHVLREMNMSTSVHTTPTQPHATHATSSPPFGFNASAFPGITTSVAVASSPAQTSATASSTTASSNAKMKLCACYHGQEQSSARHRKNVHDETRTKRPPGSGPDTRDNYKISPPGALNDVFMSWQHQCCASENHV